MSNEVNEQLLERAREAIIMWEGTTIAKVLQADLDRMDLEALHYHVKQAEAQEQEVNDTD